MKTTTTRTANTILDKRVSDTYAKDSKATLVNKLSDPYVKAIRWASDRIKDEGIVAFVTNNSYLDKIAFDGMRQHLAQDFSHIYCINLQGDVRKDSMKEGIPIGEEHTVFGLGAMVGIAVTFLIKSNVATEHKIFYAEVDWRAKRKEKFEFLEKAGAVGKVDWQEIQPDAKNTWLTEGLKIDFDSFLSIGSKETRSGATDKAESIFKTYSLGVSTNRDSVVYDFDAVALGKRVKEFVDLYNAEVARYHQPNKPADLDSFLKYDKIKWSRNLKRELRIGRKLSFAKEHIRPALYRPFTKRSTS